MVYDKDTAAPGNEDERGWYLMMALPDRVAERKMLLRACAYFCARARLQLFERVASLIGVASIKGSFHMYIELFVCFLLASALVRSWTGAAVLSYGFVNKSTVN